MSRHCSDQFGTLSIQLAPFRVPLGEIAIDCSRRLQTAETTIDFGSFKTSRRLSVAADAGGLEHASQTFVIVFGAEIASTTRRRIECAGGMTISALKRTGQKALFAGELRSVSCAGQTIRVLGTQCLGGIARMSPRHVTTSMSSIPFVCV